MTFYPQDKKETVYLLIMKSWFGGSFPFQVNPFWRQLTLLYEYPQMSSSGCGAWPKCGLMSPVSLVWFEVVSVFYHPSTLFLEAPGYHLACQRHKVDVF